MGYRRTRYSTVDRAAGTNEGSIEPLNDGTVNGEAGTPKRRRRIHPFKKAVLNVSQNLELLTQLASEVIPDRLLGPFK